MHMHKAQLVWFCEQALDTLKKLKNNQLTTEKTGDRIVKNIKNIRKTQKVILDCPPCKKGIGKPLLRCVSFLSKASYVLYLKLIENPEDIRDFEIIRKGLIKLIRFLDTEEAVNNWPETLEIFEFGVTYDENDEGNLIRRTVLELDLIGDSDSLTLLDFVTTVNKSWKSLTLKQ